MLFNFLLRIKKSGYKFVFWEIYWTVRYLTLVKSFNFFKILIQDKIDKPSVVSGFPIKLTVDPSANCVLRCPLCPTGQADKGRKRGEMQYLNFEKLINEVGRYLFEIDLFNWGEPFLNKDIFKMINLCHARNIITRLSSNLNFFPEGYEKNLVESKLNHLVVSLDGTTQETYENYRAGGSIEKVLDGVKKIRKEREKQKTRSPFLTWQFIVFDHNRHEIEQAKKLVKKWGFDRIVFIENRGDMGKELFVKKNKQKKFNCSFLWSQSVVNWDGSVSPCCLYYNEKYDFGNAFKEGFKTIWNNGKYKEARELVSLRKIYKSNVICLICIKSDFLAQNEK